MHVQIRITFASRALNEELNREQNLYLWKALLCYMAKTPKPILITPEENVRRFIEKIRNDRPLADETNAPDWTLQPDDELHRAIARMGFVCRTDRDVKQFFTHVQDETGYSPYQLDQILRTFDREAKTPAPDFSNVVTIADMLRKDMINFIKLAIPVLDASQIKGVYGDKDVHIWYNKSLNSICPTTDQMKPLLDKYETTETLFSEIIGDLLQCTEPVSMDMELKHEIL